MSNTLTDVNYIDVFQESLEAFKKTLESLSIFSTKYSSEPGYKGATTYVPVVSSQSASDGSLAATDYESGDGSDVSVAVSLSANLYRSNHLLAVEASQTRTDAFRKWMMEATYAVAAKCLVNTQNLITTAFTNASSATAASACDDDFLVDLRNVGLTTMKFKAGTFNVVLDAAYYANLLKDPSIKDAYANPATIANRGGSMFVRHGMGVYESLTLADADPYAAPATGAYLRGFVCHPSCIGVTIRPPAVLEGADTAFSMVENITDPDTHLTLQYREWIENGANIRWGCVEVLWGGARVRTDGLYRIVSA